MHLKKPVAAFTPADGVFAALFNTSTIAKLACLLAGLGNKIVSRR
jgi:hypothetical protein